MSGATLAEKIAAQRARKERAAQYDRDRNAIVKQLEDGTITWDEMRERFDKLAAEYRKESVA